MRECPQCHTPALETEKFCRKCGTPLPPFEQPAADTTAPIQPAAPNPGEPADSPKKKKIPVIPIVAAVAVLAVIGLIFGLTRSGKPGSAKKPQVVEMSADDAIEQITKNYSSRTFDESLNLSEHEGLLSADDVTGPFLEIRKEDGSYYVPDTVENENAGKELPSDAKIVEAKKDYLPNEYKQMIQSGKKAKAASKGKEDQIYALMEYTGYGNAGNYNNGGFILYYHKSRVSFYSLESGKMLGWKDTYESRRGPFILYSNDYQSDGQHPIYCFTGGSIWSDKAWTSGLDELFYDENGYQVVGDRLLDVPDDADTLEIPEGVREIEKNVGTNHQAKELIIPKGVEKIGYYAFSSSQLETITFPETVKYCDQYAFDGTPWKEDQSTEDWVIVGDGVLVKCNSDDKELEVPKEVRYIAPGAFTELKCTKITIPKSVVQCCGSIGMSSGNSPISSLESLKELVIEGGLTADIDDVPIKVLGYCDNLEKIVVDCDSDELPEDWIALNSDTYKKLTVICKDDSETAKWADTKEVNHSEK